MSKITLYLVFILTVACSQQEQDQQVKSAPHIAKVKTLILSPQPWQETIEVYGVIEATEEIHISVNFAEPVQEVLFIEGQKVVLGQVLIKLDSQRRQLRVKKAKNEVAAASAALDKSSSELQRRRKLAKLQALSKEALHTAEILQHRVAAHYQEALALLSLAERELGDSTLVSPVNGVIDKRLVEPGENTQAGKTLAIIQAIDSVRVKLYVSEKDVNFLLQGETAEVSFPALRGQQLTAVIESIGVNADKNTGNFPVYLSLSNSDGLLRPGMTAQVRLQGLSLTETLLVPESAIVDRDRQKVVFLLSKQKAIQVQPLLRVSMSEWIPVLDGLAAGDQLIIGGLENLLDGSAVQVDAD